ncbi:hypothetical protein [Halovenus sp. HT40]|uniref:hypothetical protein n=1 Tax=Halovenus sp. HT40 TaxID=3126691 RepID=UPI00300F76F9
MRRRRFIAATASTITIGVAGCFGNNDTESPRSVVRAYLEAEHEDGDPEAMAELLHSESPLDPTAGDDLDGGSLQLDTIAVEDRDLSSDEIESLQMRLSGETASSIAQQENALVKAKYEIEAPELSGSGPGDGTPSGRITVQNSYLTAVEDGDWQVVAFEII